MIREHCQKKKKNPKQEFQFKKIMEEIFNIKSIYRSIYKTVRR